eukprot:2290354-Rhodomonas_salina.1
MAGKEAGPVRAKRAAKRGRRAASRAAARRRRRRSRPSSTGHASARGSRARISRGPGNGSLRGREWEFAGERMGVCGGENGSLGGEERNERKERDFGRREWAFAEQR